MLYSCTDMATVGVKGLIIGDLEYFWQHCLELLGADATEHVSDKLLAGADVANNRLQFF